MQAMALPVVYQPLIHDPTSCLASGIFMRRAAPVDMPRWEWRTFAPLPGKFQKVQQGSTELGHTDSHEISILCLRSLHDVLIHDSTIRLKWRKQVGPGGLELWDSVLQATFPCPAQVVLRFFEAWGLPAPRLNRIDYSKTQFLEEVLPQNSDLRAVPIDKQSQCFLVDGASCEFTALTADQVKLESLSIEHEDPVLTLQVLHRLGLQAHANTSYPMGLKTALQFPIQH